MTKDTASIDLTGDSDVFNAKDWIGVEKAWPPYGDTPGYLWDAQTKVFTIPREWTAIFPEHDLLIIDFMEVPLPSVSFNIHITFPETWFKQDMSNTDIPVLLECTMPSREYLMSLDKAASQAWLDVTAWAELLELVDAQASWKASRSWLVHARQDPDLAVAAAEAERLLSLLSWDKPHPTAPITASISSMHILNPLLSKTSWVSDSLMDAMLDHLNCRLQKKMELAVQVLIGSHC
ncbi:hypothetical protein C8Q72DRAFT_885516 [Fomitopsis betulina]|nr:hypothetical protein C8Q72DRAFT_885516 [Fomitopsis betulina]